MWGKSKQSILRLFSSAELEELRLYRSIEPWGGEWDNLRAGTIASAAAGANPFRKPHDVPAAGDWFRPRRKRCSVKADHAAADRAAVRFEATRRRKANG